MANLVLVKTIEQLHELPPVRLEGWLTVELIDARTGIIKQHLRFKNLITDVGLDGIGATTSMSALTNWCAVGTDSTAPAVTQTNLGAEVSPRVTANGGISDTSGYEAGPPDYTWRKRVRLFTETQANGNLTEIGFFSASSLGIMFLRQLFKDGAGNPITITKTSSDQLRVTHELRAYPPTNDVLDTITLESVLYDTTLRVCGASSMLHWGTNSFGSGFLDVGLQANPTRIAAAEETDVLVSRTTTIGATTVLPSSATLAAYTNGNFFRDRTLKWEPGVANFTTGIGRIVLWNQGSGTNSFFIFQMKFAPKIDKTNVKRLTLVVRKSWARYP